MAKYVFGFFIVVVVCFHLIIASALQSVAVMNTNIPDEKFFYVHSSIAKFLTSAPEQHCSREILHLNPTTLILECKETPPGNHEMFIIDPAELCILACDCDDLVFGSSSLPSFRPSLQGLIELGKTNHSAKVTVATLLALNALESSIRNLTQNNAGHAPLLRNMIDQIRKQPLSAILKALLLPTPGLNLRNLLWHGFVSDIPRSFLALVLVLILNVECGQPFQREVEPAIIPLRGLPGMASILIRADTITSKEPETTAISSIKAWLPVSYHSLFDQAMGWIQERQYPATVCAVLSILLEHGLRLEWCTLNNRHDDRIARPGSFYVTLDGHGQRHQHDLLLHPYRTDNATNQLIGRLGGSTIALLTDLFCSSCGGPNLRAALSHGLWDAILINECEAFVTCQSSRTTADCEASLWDLVGATLVAMEGAAGFPVVQSYRPIFSYTAVSMNNIQQSIQELEFLETGQRLVEELDLPTRLDATAKDLACTLRVSMDSLREHAKLIFAACGCDCGNQLPKKWETNDVFAEFESNRKLSSCGASRVLLNDVALALLQYRNTMEQSRRVLQEETGLHNRQRHRHLRVLSSAEVAYSVYSFATLVALLSMESTLLDPTCGFSNGTDFQVAVERSRMVVSTFSTFLTANSERAIKAAVNFAKSKSIQSIIGR